MVEGYFDRLRRLPCEILQYIALMLPFSSIKQLRCSSKFWYNLLTDPKFVDLHLTHALEKPPGYLFTAMPKCLLQKKAYYFVEQSHGHVSTSKIFEYSFEKYEPDLWEDFQSGGGLIFAYSSQWCYFRIFNPHIGEEVKVPYDHKFIRWDSLRFIFSYSPSIKEYQILKLGELKNNGHTVGSNVAEICTLGSNIWRKIQNVPNTWWYIHPHTQCQGNLFWLEDSDLYFFDIIFEKFHVIPGPPVFDRIHVTCDSDTRVKIVSSSLISMGHTVGYVHNNKLWVLEDKTKAIWINRYKFSISLLYDNYPTLIGTSENGHLFGYMGWRPTDVFSHDIGCTGFRVMEMKLEDDWREEDSRSIRYIAPHVRSFVSPVRIMNMGKRLNHKRKRVLDTLKLDYDATEDDLFDQMYEFMEAYEKSDIKA
ncbi:putative F-box protein At5g42430 [Silene latifolia]|uniref:putative F-box protein At5g42430 n=1 Tax=Silene latifolia TaxID=37657 RepID=UPI003D77D0B0